ncbi:MAG: diaminopimelate decarboxylase [Planctomycetota bacterium]|jgi:diaminopimelate decarboxylase|nr:diaminopimelate decarboxylase [Planctomycetota bacterium]
MKLTHFNYRDGGLRIENAAAADLARRFGTPLYVYSRQSLRDAFSRVKGAFSEASTTVCYSVKSCGNLSILKLLREAGAGFDIVSGGELYRVIKAGGDPRKIVFAGVAKSDDEIAKALEHDILMLNVESEAELDNIQAVAASMGRVAPVALRLNPDVDGKTHAKTTTGKKENKFGIDLANASRLVRNIAEQPNIRLLGVDAHIGSPINDVVPYRQAMERIAAFIRDHRSPRAVLEYLNIGGGYGSLYRNERVPDFADYAAVIVPHVKATGCKLIVEPGRSIAANSAALLTRVLYVKDNGFKHFTIVDAGMNDLIRPAMYDSYHFCWPAEYDGIPPSPLFDSPGATGYFQREEEEAGIVGNQALRNIDAEGLILTDVVGPICESSDYFAKGRRIPVPERGNLMAVFSAGAYGFSMSSNYNARPRPAEVLVEGDDARVIRERERYEDLVAGESGS